MLADEEHFCATHPTRLRLHPENPVLGAASVEETAHRLISLRAGGRFAVHLAPNMLLIAGTADFLGIRVWDA
jgi:hypothetical protein